MDHQMKKRATITKEILGLISSQIQSGKSNKEISESLGISYPAICKVSNKLTHGEDASTIIKKKGRKFNNNDEITSQLLGIISSNNALTQKGMAEELSNFGTKRSQSTISKVLAKAEITRKRLVRIPEERNSERVLILRQQYAQQLQYYSCSQLVYLDETGFNLHTTLNYGYSLKNTKAYLTVPANRGQNISLMAAISVNGIIGWHLINGAYNGESFQSFITTYLIPYFAKTPNSLLVMDNCRFHHRKDILQLLNENGVPYKFLPPYTPDLNPIENFFGEIKAEYRSSVPYPKTRDQLKEKVKAIMRSKDCNFIVMFEHAKSLLPKALAKHAFI